MKFQLMCSFGARQVEFIKENHILNESNCICEEKEGIMVVARGLGVNEMGRCWSQDINFQL